MMSKVLQHLRESALRDDLERSDEELLERFVRDRDSAALEAIVRRHGVMVWGVCRRILRTNDDAEDAFQAVFLVLVRRAHAIQHRALVGNWLYGVAHQTARKARATAVRRHAREKQGIDMVEPAFTPTETDSELAQLLDDELAKLPEKYRTVVILCELEGRTLAEAARQMDVPPGTIASRLARGRAMLAKRLTRRGLAVTGVSVSGLLTHQTAAANLPTTILAAAVDAVTLAVAGKAAAAASANATALADQIVKAMFVSRLAKLTGLVVLTVAVCGAGLAAYSRIDDDASKKDQAPRQHIAKAAPVADLPKRDLNPRPLPAPEDQRFTPQNGMFTIVLPGGENVGQKTHVVAVDRHKFPFESSQSVASDGTKFVGGSIGVPAILMRDIPADRRFDAFRDLLAKEFSGSATAEKDIKHGGIPGKEYLLQQKSGTGRLRIFTIAGWVIYAFVEGESAESVHSPRADEFFTSLRFTEKATDVFDRVGR